MKGERRDRRQKKKKRKERTNKEGRKKKTNTQTRKEGGRGLKRRMEYARPGRCKDGWRKVGILTMI